VVVLAEVVQDTVEHPGLAQPGKDLPAAVEEHMAVVPEVVLVLSATTGEVPTVAMAA
jgi:hypothetical protein